MLYFSIPLALLVDKEPHLILMLNQHPLLLRQEVLKDCICSPSPSQILVDVKLLSNLTHALADLFGEGCLWETEVLEQTLEGHESSLPACAGDSFPTHHSLCSNQLLVLC